MQAAQLGSGHFALVPDSRLDIVVSGDLLRRVIVLCGEVDMATHPLLTARLGQIVDEAVVPSAGSGKPLVVVDLSGLTFLSARGAAELIRLGGALAARHRSLIVRVPVHGVRRILRIVDAGGLLHLDETDPEVGPGPDGGS